MKGVKIVPKNTAIKKVLILLVNFLLSLTVYKIILKLGDSVNLMFYYVGITAYLATASVLFCVFYFKNGSRLSTAPTPKSELPEEWSDAEVAEYLSEEAVRKTSAKKVLYVFLPMVLTVMLNYIELVLPSIIASIKG